MCKISHWKWRKVQARSCNAAIQKDNAIHQILIGSDLLIKKKHLPTDPFYKSVQIKESRRKSSIVTPLLDDDEEME